MTTRPRRHTTELETKTYSVAKLLELIRSGRVRIPRFQRGFRWNDQDRLQLFDSVQRGYPVGTLLLAQGEAGEDVVALAGYRLPVPSVSDALWVIDGQQRLATLAMALLDDHSGAYRPIFFDLDAGEFVLGTRRRAPRPRWVPTHVLASSSALNKWLREALLPDDPSDRADHVAQRVREYVVPAYLVPYDGEDDSVLTQIFARINQRGRALRSHEVFEALHTSMRGGKGPIIRVHEDLTKLGFGTIDPSYVERCAKAISSGNPDGELQSHLEGKSATEVAKLFDRVYASLARTIEFLANDAGVPHLRFLPYGGTLFTLARFFACFPDPHPRTRELLARWFWRGTISGDHRTDYSADRRNWRAIGDEEHGSIRELLRLQPKIEPTDLPSELAPFRRGNAASDIETLALAALVPRIVVPSESLERGAEVPLGTLSEGVPSQLVQPDEGQPRTIAAFLLHPSTTPEALCDGDEATDREAMLATHLIEREAFEALSKGETGRFLELRSRSMIAYLREFLADRAAVGAADHDRLALDAYNASAEGV